MKRIMQLTAVIYHNEDKKKIEFFKSYAVTINQTYGRTGRLFEEPFLRIEVNSNHQISILIKYIHQKLQTIRAYNSIIQLPEYSEIFRVFLMCIAVNF